MKNTLPALLGFILLSAPLVATAQFIYTTNNGALTITGYTGPGGPVIIPGSINGLPVIRIGDSAFRDQTSLASITIPGSVTSVGFAAFYNCTSLIAINVDAANASYSSLEGVLFNKSQTTLIQCPGGKAGNYPIPGSVTSIENYAFSFCTSLTDVTIPASVTSIGGGAFSYCNRVTSVTISNGVTSIGYSAFYGCIGLTNLTMPGSINSIEFRAFQNCTSLQGVFFTGNAPSFGSEVFDQAFYANVYYLPGTTGWGATVASRPARLWNPLMQTGGAGFGVGPAGFGFNITGTTNIPVLVEACTNLANASWVPLQSLNLTNGAFYFSDPEWTNYPARTYRIRSP